jgi:hypothetical protein
MESIITCRVREADQCSFEEHTRKAPGRRTRLQVLGDLACTVTACVVSTPTRLRPLLYTGTASCCRKQCIPGLAVFGRTFVICRKVCSGSSVGFKHITRASIVIRSVRPTMWRAGFLCTKNCLQHIQIPCMFQEDRYLKTPRARRKCSICRGYRIVCSVQPLQEKPTKRLVRKLEKWSKWTNNRNIATPRHWTRQQVLDAADGKELQEVQRKHCREMLGDRMSHKRQASLEVQNNTLHRDGR